MTIRSLHYVMDCFPHGFRQKWLQSQVLEFWAGPWKTPLCCRVLWGPWAEHQGIRLHKWGNIWKLLIYTYNIIMYMGCNMCVLRFFWPTFFFWVQKWGFIAQYLAIFGKMMISDDQPSATPKQCFPWRDHQLLGWCCWRVRLSNV